LVCNDNLKGQYFTGFYIIECTFVLVSLFGYAFWAMRMMMPSQNGKINGRLKMQLVRIAAYSLILMGLFFAGAAIVGIVLEKNIGIDITGVILYTGILASVVMAFVYSVDNVINKEAVDGKTLNEPSMKSGVIAKDEQFQVEMATIQKEAPTEQQPENRPVQKYNKSALSPVVLEDYKDKLNRLVNLDKIYLDNELTLEVLAKKMKMPMHHLTQLFNIYLGENFNQYINKYRIDYAKEALEDNEQSLSIEQIAFNSGFNSKVSFNRHFKILTGYTPKEYASNAKAMKNN
jgi:AraC-like DNA-binding protein